MVKLNGKKVLCLVTGGSQGIGQTIAVEMSKLFVPESKIIILARSKEGMERTKQEILASSKHVSVQNYQVDLSKPNLNQFNEILKENNTDQYDVYLLIHNAGSEGNGGLAKDMNDHDEWQNYMSLNLYSVTMLTSSFLQVFSGFNDKTVIVNITSLAAVQPFKGMGYYCVGKAAREMYFRTLAEENQNLSIFNYSPGPVNTEMITRVISKVSDSSTKSSFESMRDNNTLVKAVDTVRKLINTLDSDFTSGGRVDYFDL